MDDGAAVTPRMSLPEAVLLSDIQILERLVRSDEGAIFVRPVIHAVQLGPSSLDLRVGTELRVTQIIASTHIDLTETKDNVRKRVAEYFSVQRVRPDGAFVLHPQELALASTLEYLQLPLDIAGRLEGRSSFGAAGIAGACDGGIRGSGIQGHAHLRTNQLWKAAGSVWSWATTRTDLLHSNKRSPSGLHGEASEQVRRQAWR